MENSLALEASVVAAEAGLCTGLCTGLCAGLCAGAGVVFWGRFHCPRS